MKILHGESKTKLYSVWNMMNQRCFNYKNKRYKDYGDRGITVCDEWLDFTPFRDWSLNNGYAEGLQINRINNDGNYEPNNCNWVTNVENRRNREDVKLTMKIVNEIRGLYKTGNYTQKELAKKYDVSRREINFIINNKHWKR